MLLPTRQPLAYLALCAIGGIVAADLLPTGSAATGWPWAAGIAVLFPLLPSLKGMPRVAALRVALTVALLAFAWHAGRLTRGPAAALAARIPAEGQVVQAVGIVQEEPVPDAPFRLRLETVALGSETVKSSALVRVRWMGALPRYGDRVSIDGDLHRLAPPRNPGVFDGPKNWRRQGLSGQLIVRYPNDTRIMDRDCGSPFIARAYAFRHWMERILALDLADSPESAALIQSMVLGSRGDSLAETRQRFQSTGTLHLFAVSGMNVAMLAGVCIWVLQAVGIRQRTIACVVIPLLWVYCYATGLGASSLRATVMATVALAGVLIDRPPLSWNTLGAAVLILLAWDPNQLFTAGFQLSFGVAALLMACTWRIQKRLDPFTQPDPFLPRPLWSRRVVLQTRALRGLTGALAVSGIAWIASTPLLIYYFHLWAPSTIPANLFAAFFAWIMMILGLASVLAGALWPGLAIIFNNANWLMAKILLTGITAFAAIPGGHLYLGIPGLKPAPLCEIELLDLPGGGAAHLRINGSSRRDWLIDCGSASAFAYTVTPYLHSRGVNTLDGLLLTHGDSQHLGGALDLLKTFAPAEVVDSPLRDRSPSRRTVHTALDASAQGKAIVQRGDTLTLAPGVILHVLFPPGGLHAGAADDKTLVVRLDVAGRRFLFTSDAGFNTERWLLENAPPEELRSDVLIKQIHAKDFSGTPEFLNAVQPSLIVASSTRFPPQESLNEEWAAQLEARGIRLLRQDRTGAVRITVPPNGTWQAEPFLSGK
jgi:ComEC/Rec2-related protein